MRKLVVWIMLLGICSVSAAETGSQKWQGRFAASYERGKFGTQDTTETGYFPFTLERLFEKGDLGLTVPFLVLRTTGQTTLVAGVPQRSQRNRRNDIAPTGTKTEKGLGDLLLKGRFYLLDEKDWVPTLGLVGKIKFPTASHDKGLGTRKFDEGFGTELSHHFLGQWLWYLDMSYTVIGSPADQDLRNQFAVDAGAGYEFTPKILASLFYEERTAILSGEPDPRLLLLNGAFKVTDVFRVSTLLEIGLSNGAPDFGFTAGAGLLF